MTYVHTYPKGLPVLPAINPNREALLYLRYSVSGLLHTLGRERTTLQKATGKHAFLSVTKQTYDPNQRNYFGIRPAGADETALSWEEIECAINNGVVL